LYYDQADNENAIRILNESQIVIPGFATTASCIVDNINAELDPMVGC